MKSKPESETDSNIYNFCVLNICQISRIKPFLSLILKIAIREFKQTTTTTPRTTPSKKINLYFTSEIRDCLDLFITPIAPKNLLRRNAQRRRTVPNGNAKN